MVLNKAETNGQAEGWPRQVRCGRASVSVYKRKTPHGGENFMVADYSTGKRRFVSYPTEEKALEAASVLVRKLSSGQVVAAALTNAQAAEYASAVQALRPFNVSLPSAAATLAECLALLGDLPTLLAGAKDYARRRRTIDPKPVAGVVAQLLAVKEARKASPRYIADLKSRLETFAASFKVNLHTIATPQVQAWLDKREMGAQTYTNYTRVLNLLFEFGVARGFAAENPISGVEARKVRRAAAEVYAPKELMALLANAPEDFRPCIAIGAFAGCRSAEIERLRWEAFDFAGRHLVVGADRAKTASRRVIPICDALAAWLAPYAGSKGLVWKGTHDAFYGAQQAAAEAAKVPWRQNALRHSYASYRIAQTGDAARTASECGNSVAVIHAHYRELVKPEAAQAWFNVMPTQAANVVQLPQASNA